MKNKIQNLPQQDKISVSPKDEIIGTDVPFQRIRRITGYLVGDMSRWNDGKRAEERDRVKHF